MLKSTALPEAWIARLEAFCNQLGYRYIYRQANISDRISRRESFRFQSWIENVGVAPIYRRYTFALRLRQGDREAIIPLPEVDIRKWLPGDAWLDETIQMPEGFQSGWVDLAAGLMDAATQQVRVRFAVKEVFSDGWVSLGGFELTD